MKEIKYSFTSGDVETILFTLSILPSLSLEDTDIQGEMNLINCESATKKLTTGNTNFTVNEFRVIYCSLMGAQLINYGLFDVTPETKQKCASYIFTINKLVAAFKKQMD